MPIISIIVPIYKVEKYLPRCLDSILAQTFADFECILVDDCSPDNCGKICDEYGKLDSRFKVIHKEKNEGLPKARKSGLDIAVAEFVTHVDGDDWIEPNALELLYKKQQETNADIVLGNMKTIGSWETVLCIQPEIPKDISPVAYYLLYAIRAIWAKLYKRNLFLEYIVPKYSVQQKNAGEDVITNVQIFSKIKIKKLQRIDNVIYNYNKTSNGIINNLPKTYSHMWDDPRIKCRLWVEQYLDDLKCDNSTKMACLCFVYEGFVHYLGNNYNNMTKNDIDFFYKNYHKKISNSKYCKNIMIRYRIIVPILYLFPLFAKILFFLRWGIKLMQEKTAMQEAKIC
jgi:glycosyltransferase involved in cell wall biosynthesis